MKPRLLPFCLIAFLCLEGRSSAAISYTTYGSTLTENFDGLGTSAGTWTNDSTIPGWYAASRLPSPTVTFTDYIASTGNTAAAGSLQSLGGNSVNPTTDRALGSQNPNGSTSAISYAMQLTNATGAAIQGFNLQYAGELWRAISNEPADSITFDFQIFNAGAGSLDAATGWTSVSGLTFTAPWTATSTTRFDGNLEANRALLSASITGITWGQGQELWLRWTDGSTSGNRRAAVGIDDVSFTAIPEPASAAFGSLTAAIVLLGRRKRTR